MEWIPVVDSNGQVLSQAPRGYVHSGAGVLHPVVHLHIINRMGQIYLQKRSQSKELLPGYWDTAVGGHIGYGESPIETLFREAREELGLEDFNPVFLDSYEYESATERELVYVFGAVGNFQPVPDHGEVEDGAWWDADKISSAIGKDTLTPNFETEYERIKSALEAML